MRTVASDERTIRQGASGSDAYSGVIYEKLKFAYEILDKMVLPYHLRAPSLSAKPAFSA
jgi:hypothetical protein